MTLAELKEKLSSLSETDRATHIKKLWPLLSGVSKQMLTKFQFDWDSDRGFKEFVAEQNKVIQTCITLEVSPFGLYVRKTLGMEPLTLETSL